MNDRDLEYSRIVIDLCKEGQFKRVAAVYAIALERL
jgi:hypothetical protein